MPEKLFSAVFLAADQGSDHAFWANLPAGGCVIPLASARRGSVACGGHAPSQRSYRLFVFKRVKGYTRFESKLRVGRIIANPVLEPSPATEPQERCLRDVLSRGESGETQPPRLAELPDDWLSAHFRTWKCCRSILRAWLPPEPSLWRRLCPGWSDGDGCRVERIASPVGLEVLRAAI